MGAGASAPERVVPVWLKVALITLGTLAVLMALAIYIFARMIGGIFDGFVEGFTNPTGSAPAAETGPQEVRFLQTEGFDPTAPGAAIILHPAFTGLANPVAVTDPALLAEAADTAFFTDNRSAETRMVLLSILFLSPPGNGTRSAMVSLFQDGREVGTLTCFTGQCPRGGPPTAPYDLAGLEASAQPVTLEDETVMGLPAARAFQAELLEQPGTLLTNDVQDLPEAATRFDGYMRVRLPSTFGPWEEFSSYRGDAEQAAFETGLRQIGQGTEIPFEITYSFSRTSWTQYVIHDAATERAVVDANGYEIVDGWLPHIIPQADLWVAAEDADALRAALLAYDWADPRDPPADDVLAARIPQVMAAHDLPGAAEDYMHRATVFDMEDDVIVGPFREPEVYFSYYRLVE
ncbi:hypothetical protein [Gymnodinialimonas hymeniacidonis]|uniref:hypothetical protein n=1 Tax=Gymnodinialimonas hymeniacidonis TaxID=3126508 RepID=UPI0034C64D1B